MCLAQVVGAVTSQDLAGGFVVPPLLRFVSAEDAYLSNTNGGARMFFNIEDHLSWNTGVVNARFQARTLSCASSEEGGIHMSAFSASSISSIQAWDARRHMCDVDTLPNERLGGFGQDLFVQAPAAH